MTTWKLRRLDFFWKCGNCYNNICPKIYVPKCNIKDISYHGDACFSGQHNKFSGIKLVVLWDRKPFLDITILLWGAKNPFLLMFIVLTICSFHGLLKNNWIEKLPYSWGTSVCEKSASSHILIVKTSGARKVRAHDISNKYISGERCASYHPWIEKR